VRLTLRIVNGKVNGALTDNGQQKCTIQNFNYGLLTAGKAPIAMGCVAGYSASYDLNAGTVRYRYGSFDGTFAVKTGYVNTNNDAFRATAKVWGC
jgi:hypothetical protein